MMIPFLTSRVDLCSTHKVTMQFSCANFRREDSTHLILNSTCLSFSPQTNDGDIPDCFTSQKSLPVLLFILNLNLTHEHRGTNAIKVSKAKVSHYFLSNL